MLGMPYVFPCQLLVTSLFWWWGVKGEYPEQRKLQRLDINERKLQLRKDFLDLPCLVVCHVREGLAGWEMIALVEVVVSAEAEERDEEGVSEEEGGDVYEDKCTGLHYGWGYESESRGSLYQSVREGLVLTPVSISPASRGPTRRCVK